MTESDLEVTGIPDRQSELSALEDTARLALEHAKRLGADQVEASVSIQYGLDVNVRKGEVETLQHSRDSGLGVSVFLGQAKGHATSGDMRADSVRLCVEKAVDIARFTQSDKCNGLAPADRLATAFPDLDLWHPQPMDVEAAVSRALECEAAGLAHPEISKDRKSTRLNSSHSSVSRMPSSA